MTTTVVHCKREEYDVYIGRPSKWGNPFRMRDKSDEERKRVISQYEEWLFQQPKLMTAIREELAGKRLGCWCAPKPCHGDILAMFADMDDETFWETCRMMCEWW